MERRHVWVAGRVQGVWFRQACADEARALGVGGWVRNLPDGRVEAVFEGALSSVERMVAWCHHGPPRAQVTEVRAATEAPEQLTTFRISGES